MLTYQVPQKKAYNAYKAYILHAHCLLRLRCLHRAKTVVIYSKKGPKWGINRTSSRVFFFVHQCTNSYTSNIFENSHTTTKFVHQRKNERKFIRKTNYEIDEQQGEVVKYSTAIPSSYEKLNSCEEIFKFSVSIIVTSNPHLLIVPSNPEQIFKCIKFCSRFWMRRI